MGRTLIYRDAQMITDYLAGYQKGIAEFQSIINKLVAQGVTLTDNVLHDLNKGGAEIKKAVKCQIDEELAKLKFQASKDELKKNLMPLLDEVDKAVDKVRKASYIQHGLYASFTIDIDSKIVVEGLKVRAVPNLEEIITEQFSTYADDPVMKEAYKRAQKLEKELNDYADFLRQHGDWLVPVGIDGLATKSLAVIGIDGDNRAHIRGASFRSLFEKKRKQ